MARTPLSRSRGQRSRSPGRFIHRRVNASGNCIGERGNALVVGNYLLRCGLLCGARRFGAHRERKGAGAYRGGRPPTAYYYYYYIDWLMTDWVIYFGDDSMLSVAAAPRIETNGYQLSEEHNSHIGVARHVCQSTTTTTTVLFHMNNSSKHNQYYSRTVDISVSINVNNVRIIDYVLMNV